MDIQVRTPSVQQESDDVFGASLRTSWLDVAVETLSQILVVATIQLRLTDRYDI